MRHRVSIVIISRAQAAFTALRQKYMCFLSGITGVLCGTVARWGIHLRSHRQLRKQRSLYCLENASRPHCRLLQWTPSARDLFRRTLRNLQIGLCTCLNSGEIVAIALLPSVVQKCSWNSLTLSC